MLVASTIASATTAILLLFAAIILRSPGNLWVPDANAMALCRALWSPSFAWHAAAFRGRGQRRRRGARIDRGAEPGRIAERCFVRYQLEAGATVAAPAGEREGGAARGRSSCACPAQSGDRSWRRTLCRALQRRSSWRDIVTDDVVDEVCYQLRGHRTADVG